MSAAIQLAEQITDLLMKSGASNETVRNAMYIASILFDEKREAVMASVAGEKLAAEVAGGVSEDYR